MTLVTTILGECNLKFVLVHCGESLRLSFRPSTCISSLIPRSLIDISSFWQDSPFLHIKMKQDPLESDDAMGAFQQTCSHSSSRVLAMIVMIHQYKSIWLVNLYRYFVMRIKELPAGNGIRYYQVA
jgi:hypothetical protein